MIIIILKKDFYQFVFLFVFFCLNLCEKYIKYIINKKVPKSSERKILIVPGQNRDEIKNKILFRTDGRILLRVFQIESQNHGYRLL